MSTPELTLLQGYQLQLPTFEGPLDVLLRLIERDQLAITDISLLSVTDQFVAYVDGLDGAPPATIAEFAAVAARLVLLKSRSLLPRPAGTPEEENDPADLVRQLHAYRAYKDAALRLAKDDAEAQAAFARGLGVAVPSPVILAPLAPHQPAALVRALRRRFSVAAAPVQTIFSRPVITLREMLARALEGLGKAPTMRFRDLLSPDADRHEALTAFLAVLVLVRRRMADATQLEPFGDIVVAAAVAAPSLQPDDDAVDFEPDVASA